MNNCTRTNAYFYFSFSFTYFFGKAVSAVEEKV